jgi:hypothetical protein
MEVLIAVSLLSLLSVGILMAMRVGLGALEKANTRLMNNRRVAGAQRVLADQIAGFMPVMAVSPGGPGAPAFKFPFFHGEPQSMRFVSTYSLEQAWRGAPQIVEFQVIPGENGRGVRLVVNEIPYTGPLSAGRFALGRAVDTTLGAQVIQFQPIAVGPTSFVLADRLAFCRFQYKEPAPPPMLERWTPRWILERWPLALRIDMAPLEDDPAGLRPLSVSAPIRVRRSPEIPYGDY